jgi:hypothetical protein
VETSTCAQAFGNFDTRTYDAVGDPRAKYFMCFVEMFEVCDQEVHSKFESKVLIWPNHTDDIDSSYRNLNN